MTASVAIPIDDQAERDCAGLAAIGPNSAADLLSRLDPADLYYPKNQRILLHALDGSVLAAEDAAEPHDKLEARLQTLAVVAEVDVDYVRQVTELPAYGRRRLAPRLVTLAARRRRLMQLSANTYNKGNGLSSEDLEALVAAIDELRAELADLERPGLVSSGPA